MSNNVVPLKTGGSVAAIIPQSVEEVFRVAKAIEVSGLAPNGLKKAEAIAVAIMHGAELGLSPMQAVQKIAVVNGRPSVMGDAAKALLLAKGFRIREDMNADQTLAICTVTRPDGETFTRQFSKADAMRAGLWGKSGPWQQYPQRMLAYRALGFAARDGAADVLMGLYLTEEARDIVDVTPERKSSAAAKRDGDDARLNALRAAIAACETPSELATIRAAHASDWESMPTRWVQLIEDDWSLKVQDMSDAVLRNIERDAQNDLPAANDKWAQVVLALPDDARDMACDMLFPDPS